MHFSGVAGLALAMLMTTKVHAFWRQECRSSTGLARIDPLMSFGTASEHLHSAFGSSGFSETSGFSDLMNGHCTSCSVAQDKSAYWQPNLLFKDSQGLYHIVPQVGGMLAYYLLYPNSGSTNVTAFPAGFRMVAGDTYQRNFTLPVPDPPKSEWASDPQQSPQAALRQKALGFNCLNYAIAPEGSLFRHTLPPKAYLDANCLDGVRFELMFPSCSNGQLDSHDHKSHVAYPSLVMTGDCPPEYPTRLISLFYETIYDTYSFRGQDGEFVISNGDPTGCGYHGDFITGWSPSFLQQVADECTNPSGKIQDCPLFDIQSPDVYSSCTFPIPPALSSECAALSSPMTTIPGNVQIAPGPGYASPDGAATGTNSVALPTLSYSAGKTAETPGAYLPGDVFLASPAAPSHPSTTTPAPATPPALPPGESIAGTIYTTIGQSVVEIVIVDEDIIVTVDDSMTTSTPIAPQKREHLHRHRRGHGRLSRLKV